MTKILSYILKSVLTIYMSVVITQIGAQSITVDNNSYYEGNGKWKWTVFIKASSEILNSIQSVQYKLHSTFPDRTPIVRSFGSLSTPFGLTRTGWGTFEVGITINYKTGRKQTLKYFLKFIEKNAATTKSIKPGNIAIRVDKDWWKWTVFVKASPDVLDQIKCVEYGLHESFPNPIQLICTKGSNNNQAFPFTTKGWGTFTIKVKVIFKDGTTQNLKYELVF